MSGAAATGGPAGLLDGRRWRLMLAALIIAELAGTYETAMIYAALPTLIRVFDDVVGVSWLITIYLLMGSVFAVLTSRLGDILGRTQLLLAVLAMITIGSVISASSDSLLWINVGRAFQGAAAALLPLSYGIVRELAPPERTSVTVGILTGAASIGAGAGLIVGALLIDNFLWRSIFLVSASLGALSFLLVWAWVPRRPIRKVRLRGLDLLGGVLFAPALCLLLLVLTNGAKWGLGAPLTLSMLGGSLLLFWIWARHELREANPLIDVRLLARREIALTNAAMAFVGVGAYQITQLLTLLLQQPRSTLIGLGVSATAVGLIKLPANASGLIGSILSGHMAARWGARYALACGAGGIALAWLFMSVFHWSLAEVAAGLVLASFALPMMSAAASNIIIAAAPMNRISEATGLSTVVRIAASALGSQLIALTLAASSTAAPGGGEARYPSAEAFGHAFIWITACSAVAVLITLLLPRAAGRAPAEAAA